MRTKNGLQIFYGRFNKTTVHLKKVFQITKINLRENEISLHRTPFLHFDDSIHTLGEKIFLSILYILT